MYRSSVPAGVDKAVFSNTAVRSRKINLDPRIMRGGIRL